MNLKWIGAVIILLGCGGFGFYLAAQYRLEERNYRQLIGVLDYMECELEYKLSSLPELCKNAAGVSAGSIRRLFELLSGELDRQIAPDASCCMQAALSKCGNLSVSLQSVLTQLGKTLGRFDLPGQLRGIANIRRTCVQALERMDTSRESRLRSYQTLGLCAGAALAILLL